ncbi:MAG: hypothetical protein RBS29_01175 [Bacteroidales bacterium]|jgi:hypothetical protein|nr:hypothetical protein [Bacteroidales bacterium]
MKNLNLLVLALCVLFTTSLTAQKPFSGKIKYKTAITGTDDPSITSQSIPETEIIILGNQSKSVSKQEFGSITSISNGDTKTSHIIYEFNGFGKFYMTMTDSMIKAQQKFISLSYNYLEETKQIAGYTCKKVICTQTNLETDEEKIVTLYVSTEISNNDLLNYDQFIGLVGFPMSIETEYNEEIPGSKVLVEVIEVDKTFKVKSLDFLLPADAEFVKDEKDLMRKLGIEAPEEE